MRTRVFCDFDGTIAVQDVGNLLFRTFTDGGWREWVGRWIRGEISSRECLEAECALVQATEAELERFVLTQEMDPHFPTFVQHCREKEIPITLLSDGLDFYIERILAQNDLSDLPFYANHLALDHGKLTPEFPYHDAGCGKCGNCKVFHITQGRAPDEQVVYIGDGYSDRWAAQNADHVFAKKDLLKCCREEGIACHEYADLGDVLRILPTLLG
ncbi:MAG: MtnX-like HAD-IB family phosphatase [Candidatus Latescibacterota bacterium]